jgi:hypothetical protein
MACVMRIASREFLYNVFHFYLVVPKFFPIFAPRMRDNNEKASDY